MPLFELLAVDLDGTLLDSSRSVPARNRAALHRAHRTGIKLAVVTGRRLPAASSSLRDIDLELMLVLNGGALIRQGLEGPFLDRKLLPLEAAKQVMALGYEAGVEPVVHDGPSGEGNLIIRSAAASNPSLTSYLEKTAPAPRWVTHATEALERDPVQIMFAATVEVIRSLAERIRRALLTQVSLARTEYLQRDLALLDVLAPQATKANAFRFLARRLGIPCGRTMAIGDNWNDLGMLEAAGLGVVMANAPGELRAKGFPLTGSNDEAGVASAIERYVL